MERWMMAKSLMMTKSSTMMVKPYPKAEQLMMDKQLFLELKNAFWQFVDSTNQHRKSLGYDDITDYLIAAHRAMVEHKDQ